VAELHINDPPRIVGIYPGKQGRQVYLTREKPGKLVQTTDPGDYPVNDGRAKRGAQWVIRSNLSRLHDLFMERSSVPTAAMKTPSLPRPSGPTNWPSCCEERMQLGALLAEVAQ
jgi:hypothetical protein